MKTLFKHIVFIGFAALLLLQQIPKHLLHHHHEAGHETVSLCHPASVFTEYCNCDIDWSVSEFAEGLQIPISAENIIIQKQQLHVSAPHTPTFLFPNKAPPHPTSILGA